MGKVCFTEVRNKVRGKERRGLDMGETVDRRSNDRMHMEMEILMAGTSIAAQTAAMTQLNRWSEMRMESGQGAVRSRPPPRPSGTGGGAWRARLSGKPTNWHSYTEPSQNGKHAGDTHCTAGGAVARDEIMVGGHRETMGRAPPG